jgi:hypothetical protein
LQPPRGSLASFAAFDAVQYIRARVEEIDPFDNWLGFVTGFDANSGEAS